MSSVCAGACKHARTLKAALAGGGPLPAGFEQAPER
jgi:hypothetical protein